MLFINAFALIAQLAFGVEVYKTPDSLLSSGSVSINKLLHKGDVQTRTWYFNNQGQRFLRSQIILPQNLTLKAKIANTSHLLCEPSPISSPCGATQRDDEVEILKIKDSYVKIKGKSYAGWLTEEKILPLYTQFGYGISKKSVELLKQPKAKSKKIATLKENSKVKINNIKGSWALIFQNDEIKGWALISDFITQFNFVNKVNNQKIKSITGGWVQTQNKNITSLDKVESANFSKNIFITSNSLKHKIKNIKTIKWTSYYSKNTGLVWFSDLNVSDNQLIQTQISNEDFFGTPVFDIASHPEVPEFKIASKNGIYKTIDGLTWEKISFFKNKNYPLVILPSGVIYVGPYVSFDGANTFNQYLRYENLLKTFTKRSLRIPIKISMSSLKYISERDTLQLVINKKFSFESSDPQRRYWQLSGSEHNLKQSRFSLGFLVQTSEALKHRKHLLQAKPERKHLATIVSY